MQIFHVSAWQVGTVVAVALPMPIVLLDPSFNLLQVRVRGGTTQDMTLLILQPPSPPISPPTRHMTAARDRPA